ncbi:MAG: B12-binding domain-containing radical SAM protein [Bacillota bacterium]
MINLIRAPFHGDEFVVPLGLVSLASAVERSHGAVITDLCLSLERGEIDLTEEGHRRAAEIVMAAGKRVLGFTAMCNSYPAALSIARECKRADPGCIIIFGGPQASVVDRETLAEFPFVDIIVRGEGEETLPELLTALGRGEPLNFVDGITFRAGGEVISTPARSPIPTLDELPFPNFRLVPRLEEYFAWQPVKEAAIEAGRGCPYACTFCSTSEFFSRKYRIKSPARIMAEMDWFARHLGITNFTLHHDNFNAARPKVLAFCDAMEEAGVGYTWRCSSRTDNIREDLAQRMASAGCRSVFFGIESGSPAVQQQMNKRLDVSTAREMVAACLRHGITPTCSFIVGFPEETEADMNMTLTLALECRLLGTPSIQLHPLSPLPGTELTVTNRYPLQFRPEAVRVHDASPAGAVSPGELEMIRRHPRIFSSFYMIEPTHLPVDQVYRCASILTTLIRHAPRSLYWYGRATGLSLTEVVERLRAYLPAEILSTEPEPVFGAMAELLAGAAPAWLADLLRWESTCYAVQQAPPLEPAPETKKGPGQGSLSWAPGARLIELRYALEALTAPPDIFAPPPLPSPPLRAGAYLLVRDGMVVRTLGLPPDTARLLSQATAPGDGLPEGPEAAETVRSFWMAGILRSVEQGAAAAAGR